jgi:hypothetical protein
MAKFLVVHPVGKEIIFDDKSRGQSVKAHLTPDAYWIRSFYSRTQETFIVNGMGKMLNLSVTFSPKLHRIFRLKVFMRLRWRFPQKNTDRKELTSTLSHSLKHRCTSGFFVGKREFRL